MTLSPDIIACAIVAAGRVCEEDPEEAYIKQIGSTRRYALWLLDRFLPDANISALARCVGYARSSGNVICSPSMKKRLKFSGALFDRAWIEFNRLLERFAPEVIETESSCLPPAIVAPSPARLAKPPQNSPPLTLPADPDTAHIIEKSQLRSMIEQAFANTPGARKA